MQTTWKNESVSVGSVTVTMEYRDERLTTLKLSRPLGVSRADFEAAIDEVNNRCPRPRFSGSLQHGQWQTGPKS